MKYSYINYKKTLIIKYRKSLYKYNKLQTVLQNAPILLSELSTRDILEMNWLKILTLGRKPFQNAIQFYVRNRLYKPKHIKLPESIIRLKKLNIYNKFISIIMRRGLKKRIFNLFSLLFKDWCILKFHEKSVYIREDCDTERVINYNWFYRTYIFIFLKSYTPILTLESTRIDKKKRKALRLKHRFNYKIQYLPVYRRLQVIYKWLNLELMEKKKYQHKRRLFMLYKNIFLKPENLILYKLKDTLHLKMFERYLSKRV